MSERTDKRTITWKTGIPLVILLVLIGLLVNWGLNKAEAVEAEPDEATAAQYDAEADAQEAAFDEQAFDAEEAAAATEFVEAENDAEWEAELQEEGHFARLVETCTTNSVSCPGSARVRSRSDGVEKFRDRKLGHSNWNFSAKERRVITRKVKYAADVTWDRAREMFSNFNSRQNCVVARRGPASHGYSIPWTCYSKEARGKVDQWLNGNKDGSLRPVICGGIAYIQYKGLDKYAKRNPWTFIGIGAGGAVCQWGHVLP